MQHQRQKKTRDTTEWRNDVGDWAIARLQHFVLRRSLQQQRPCCIADGGVGHTVALAGLGVFQELEVHLQTIAVLTQAVDGLHNIHHSCHQQSLPSSTQLNSLPRADLQRWTQNQIRTCTCTQTTQQSHVWYSSVNLLCLYYMRSITGLRTHGRVEEGVCEKWVGGRGGGGGTGSEMGDESMVIRWRGCCCWLRNVPGVSARTGRPGVSILWLGEVESLISNSVWQHIKLSEQIRPWDTLACCWDDKQPTNKQTLFPPKGSRVSSWQLTRRNARNNIPVHNIQVTLMWFSTDRTVYPRLNLCSLQTVYPTSGMCHPPSF